MPFVESADGVKLAVNVIGSGEPVTVVGHGLTQDRHVFEIPAQFMPGTKVLFDFRGHGDSDRPPPGSYSFDHFAGDVRAVADAYAATRVVGISLGGGSTLRLLEDDPDRFEKLVLILPARVEETSEPRKRLLRLAEALERYPPDRAAEMIVAAEDAEGSFADRPGKEYRRQAIAAMNGDGIPRAIREVIEERAVRDRESIRRIRIPTLIIGQEGDDVHDVKVARELAEALPHSELVVLPDTSAWMESLPQLVQHVAAFLAN